MKTWFVFLILFEFSALAQQRQRPRQSEVVQMISTEPQVERKLTIGEEIQRRRAVSWGFSAQDLGLSEVQLNNLKPESVLQPERTCREVANQFLIKNNLGSFGQASSFFKNAVFRNSPLLVQLDNWEVASANQSGTIFTMNTKFLHNNYFEDLIHYQFNMVGNKCVPSHVLIKMPGERVREGFVREAKLEFRDCFRIDHVLSKPNRFSQDRLLLLNYFRRECSTIFTLPSSLPVPVRAVRPTGPARPTTTGAAPEGFRATETPPK